MLKLSTRTTCRLFPMLTRAASSATSEPTYTYLPPGCSMREPVYISLSDPVYFYDMPPSKLTAAQQQALDEAKKQQAEAQIAQAPAAMKAAFEALSKPADKASAYRMVDDMSQQTYVVSPNHSMRDPKYVSVTDPKYSINTATAPSSAPSGKKPCKQ